MRTIVIKTSFLNVVKFITFSNVLLIVVAGCDKYDEVVYDRLQSIDVLMQILPETAYDSLLQVDLVLLDTHNAALHYAREAVNTSYQRRNREAYNNLADLAASNVYYKYGLIVYEKAFRLLSGWVKHETDKCIQELEKRYRLSKVKFKAERQYVFYKLALFVCVIALLSTMFGLFCYRLHVKRNKTELDNEKLRAKTIEDEVNKKNLLLAIYRTIAYNNFNHRNLLADLSRDFWGLSISKDLTKKDINRIFREKHDGIESMLIKSKYHFTIAMTGLIESKLFETHIQIPDFIKLTTDEKAILFFLYLKVPNKEIALLLRTNLNNLGTKKVNLKRKLCADASKTEHLLDLFL